MIMKPQPSDVNIEATFCPNRDKDIKWGKLNLNMAGVKAQLPLPSQGDISPVRFIDMSFPFRIRMQVDKFKHIINQIKRVSDYMGLTFSQKGVQIEVMDRVYDIYITYEIPKSDLLEEYLPKATSAHAEYSIEYLRKMTEPIPQGWEISIGMSKSDYPLKLIIHDTTLEFPYIRIEHLMAPKINQY